jgi:hypothetical protein
MVTEGPQGVLFARLKLSHEGIPMGIEVASRDLWIIKKINISDSTTICR